MHGLTAEAIVLADVAYCPADDCTSVVHLVHSALDDIALIDARQWNSRGGPGSTARRTPRPAQAPEASERTGEGSRAAAAPAAAAAVPTPAQRADRLAKRKRLRAAARDVERRLLEQAAATEPFRPLPVEDAPPAATAEAIAPEAPAAAPTPPQAPPGPASVPSAVRVRTAPARWRCDVCGMRRDATEKHVTVESLDEQPVVCARLCARCAADGDPEMRAAAAPLLAARTTRRSA